MVIKSVTFIKDLFNEFNESYIDAYNDFSQLLKCYEYYLKDFKENPEVLDEPLKEYHYGYDKEIVDNYKNIIDEVLKKIGAYRDAISIAEGFNQLRNDLYTVINESQDEELIEKIYDDYLHFLTEILASRRILSHFITCLGLDLL